MTLSDIAGVALGVFIVIVVLIVGVLMLDYWLTINGYESITHYAHDHIWLAVLLVSFVQIATISLAIHFVTYRVNQNRIASQSISFEK